MVIGTHRLIYEAGVEIHVGIELALDEVFVFESDALALQSDFEEGVLAHELEDFVSDVLDDAGARIVILVNAMAEPMSLTSPALTRLMNSGTFCIEPISMSMRRTSRIHQARQSRRSQAHGFGHRVYKNYDPRARIIKHIAYEVFELMGKNPLLEIALECERMPLEDEYFVKRKLYPTWISTPASYINRWVSDDMFPVSLRDSTHFRLDRAVGRDAPGLRAENCSPAADLSRARHASLRCDRSTELIKDRSHFAYTLRDALDNPIPWRIVIL